MANVREDITEVFDDHVHELVEEWIVEAKIATVQDCAAEDAAQHVSAAFD